MLKVELADIWLGLIAGNSGNIDRKIQCRVRSTPEKGGERSEGRQIACSSVPCDTVRLFSRDLWPARQVKQHESRWAGEGIEEKHSDSAWQR